MRAHVHGSRYERRGGWVTLRYVTPGRRYNACLPWSEICMHMQVADAHMQVELTKGPYPMAQLYRPDGTPFSFPILPGEAGLYSDGAEFYLYEPDSLTTPQQEAA